MSHSDGIMIATKVETTAISSLTRYLGKQQLPSGFISWNGNVYINGGFVLNNPSRKQRVPIELPASLLKTDYNKNIEQGKNDHDKADRKHNVFKIPSILIRAIGKSMGKSNGTNIRSLGRHITKINK